MTGRSRPHARLEQAVAPDEFPALILELGPDLRLRAVCNQEGAVLVGQPFQEGKLGLVPLDQVERRLVAADRSVDPDPELLGHVAERAARKVGGIDVLEPFGLRGGLETETRAIVEQVALHPVADRSSEDRDDLATLRLERHDHFVTEQLIEGNIQRGIPNELDPAGGMLTEFLHDLENIEFAIAEYQIADRDEDGDFHDGDSVTARRPSPSNSAKRERPSASVMVIRKWR